MLDNLKKYRVLLGSKSPRRRELLAQLGVEFSVADMPDIEEVYPAETPAAEVPAYLAQLKASAMRGSLAEDQLLITADTVVVLNGQIFGKPHDAHDAARMLRALSGQTHQVYTGVAVTTADRCSVFTSVTDVSFSHLSDAEIDYYITTYHPMDKAGAYGIQEWIGAVAVQGLVGSYYNVMGLPIHMLYHELKKF